GDSDGFLPSEGCSDSGVALRADEPRIGVLRQNQGERAISSLGRPCEPWSIGAMNSILRSIRAGTDVDVQAGCEPPEEDSVPAATAPVACGTPMLQGLGPGVLEGESELHPPNRVVNAFGCHCPCFMCEGVTDGPVPREIRGEVAWPPCSEA